jgi:hypothetical protein
MAWPLTALTTYVAGTTPSIKASDLNSIQDAINKTLLGTYTHKIVVADATGGATPPAGSTGAFRGIAGATVSSAEPLYVAADSANHNRWSVDQFGYPGSGDCDIVFFNPYTFFATLTNPSDAAVGESGWIANGSNSTVARVLGPGSSPLTRFPCIEFSGSAAATVAYVSQQTSAFSSAGSIVNRQNDTLCVADFKVAMSNAGSGNTVDYKLGFTTSPTTGGTGAGNNWDSQNGAWFEKRTADTDWQLKSSDGTVETTSASGDTPASDTFQNLRIAIAGSATLGSAAVYFFINGKHKATHTTRVPSGDLNLCIRQDNTSAVSRKLYIATTRYGVNRSLAPLVGQ